MGKKTGKIVVFNEPKRWIVNQFQKIANSSNIYTTVGCAIDGFPLVGSKLKVAMKGTTTVRKYCLQLFVARAILS